MDADQWIRQISEAYKAIGVSFTPHKRDFLLGPMTESATEEQKRFAFQATDVITRYFFNRAARGEPFGSLSRITERFGRSLEENYGLTTGPFINLARTYWTFQREVDDLFPEHRTRALSMILRKIEVDIGSRRVGHTFSVGVGRLDSLFRLRASSCTHAGRE